MKIQTVTKNSGEPIITRSNELKPYSDDIEIGQGGKVNIVGRLVGRQKIRDKVWQFFGDKQKELFGEPDTFWRFTSNSDEIKLAKTAKLRKSSDHRDSRTENGISVSEHIGYSVAGYKYGYRVTGRIKGYGADGEPLLNPATVKVVGKLLNERGIRKERIKDLDQFQKTLQAHGWTDKQYSRIIDGKFELPYN